MREISRVAVLGSGVMGSAIAAHLANCGIPSLMLDIVPPGLSGADKSDKAKRNYLAQASKDALLKAKPSPVYRKSYLDLIEVGNFEDDLPRIADCDWIVEVVKEDLDIKKKVFAAVAKHRSPGSVVTSNTSGILLRSMVEPMDDDMRAHFFGTHFFNPPRYLKLLEFIPGPDTLPEVVDGMGAFAENVLGKGVVRAKDTPDFIANRILTFACQYILKVFRDYALTIEDVDALTGPNIGHARSATFRTLDLVGVDTYLHVIGNVYNGCPNDEQRDLFAPPDCLVRMVDQGLLGEKSGSGFFQKTEARDEKGKRVILSLDLDTMEYTPQEKKRFDCIGAARGADSLEAKVRAMHTGEDEGSKFVWAHFANMAVYAANRIPEIADDIVSIDHAVKWGFAWEIGIFETWDALGVEYVCDRMKADGLEAPPIAQALLDAGYDSFYRTEAGRRQYFDLASKGYLDVPQNPRAFALARVKQAGGVVEENEGASLVDLGDGIVCVEFHTKMNAIDADLLAMMQAGVNLVNEGRFAGMVVANQGDHFSAGANLFLILGEIMQENWAGVEQAAQVFQQVNMAMRFCKGPVVAAPHHYTFGGGIELTQHAARVVVAGETYGGLVEAGVGVIPAGGGSKEMLRRALAYVPDNVPEGDPFPYVRRAFETIGMAKVSTSGAELIELGYLSDNDVVCVNFDHQISRAKAVCLGLIQAGYEPPRPARLVALGEPARAAFRSGVYQMQRGGYASEHDALIAEHIARVLTGGDRMPGTAMSEQDVLDLEREAFCSLCGTEKTQARIQHMLAEGKPLRN
ncbi:MAG: 3-hydroxyacyl-CoA dehydrogenase/enoyl-CoA hydratase family protein [Candidatus Hydrogenedentes bacterium]|nr:3-hydroxyacyl-CoA dehydrogenase/enoyl-CoA hydratase family protein [Candidatus Hydrogenedentota bacterium]